MLFNTTDHAGPLPDSVILKPPLSAYVQKTATERKYELTKPW